MVSWIGATSIERMVALKFGRWASEPTHIFAGLPQGSLHCSTYMHTAVIARVTSRGLGRALIYVDYTLGYIHKVKQTKQYVTMLRKHCK